MCCILTLFLFLGPRAALVVWWLFNPARYASAFSNFILPVLGIIFFPFTTLFYLFIWSPFNEITVFGWILLIFGALLDLSSYSGGGYFHRQRLKR